MQVTPDQHVVEDRELVKKCCRLKGTHEAAFCDGARPEARDVLFLEENPPAARRVEAADHVEGRGLTRTIGSNQTTDLPLLNQKREVGHGEQSTEPSAKMLNLQYRH